MKNNIENKSYDLFSLKDIASKFLENSENKDKYPNLNKIAKNIDIDLNEFPEMEYGFEKLWDNNKWKLLTHIDSIIDRSNLKEEIIKVS